MNTALIMAGGVGERTHQDIPKQFLNVFDKPIIIYTLEAFQNHPDVDAILVSCLSGWEDILWAYAKQFNITKLRWVIRGGTTGQETARNGALALKDICNDDDIIIQHDAIRPMVSPDIISDCIVKAKKYGTGLAAMRCQETVIRSTDGISGKTVVNRWEIMRVQTPQAYKYKTFLWVHEEAIKKGIVDAVYTNTIMVDLGEEVYFSLGSEKNLKITTLEDIDMFKALYRTKRDEWLK